MFHRPKQRTIRFTRLKINRTILYLHDNVVEELSIQGLKLQINPEKPDVPLNKNDAFQKVQKRRVQEKR